MPIDLLAVSAAEFTDEASLVRQLAGQAQWFTDHHEAIRANAEKLVLALRKSGKKSPVEAFMGEYGLDSREGVAILCLAEALLRIPDADTADTLIRGSFKEAHWLKHVGRSDSLWVNASTWGLMLTGGLVQITDIAEGGIGALFGRLAGRIGEPVVREALKAGMRLIGGQFVLGETIEDAIAESEAPWRYSYDLLGEGARTDAQSEHYAQAYAKAIQRIAASKEAKKATTMWERPSLSIKLSALHPRYELVKRETMIPEMLARLKPLLIATRDAGLMATIDAEESYRLDVSLMIFEKLAHDPDFKGYDGLGLAVQAYQTRALHVVSWLAELAKKTERRIPIRLVKGAYWDAEIKRAQVLGLPGYPVFTRKEATDASYLACARVVIEAGDAFYPQFATHNALTVASILHLLQQRRGASFEFQRLHGMGEGLYEVLGRDVPCRVYAPVGPHKDLLAYLIRRLLENGANTSFVHLLVDTSMPLELLLGDPLKKLRGYIPGIDLPVALYGTGRRNSQGMDFGNMAALTRLDEALHVRASEQPPKPADASTAESDKALAIAKQTFSLWDETSALRRAVILEKAAGLIESRRDDFLAMLATEAGKTLADGIAEIREAADMCRYYAMQARRLFLAPESLAGPTGEYNGLRLRGRGVFVCISPWNFPLAIFVGQVAAALAAGNTVIAKPAEETPLIALEAVRLLHEAGIPREALHIVPGDGKVGAALTNDIRVSGVAFTGSTEVALTINRTLAARNAPLASLIAETGGVNAMIVDSSALLEQACDDIVLSAFGSAGQRCSSLRVLYVQQEIADDLLQLLKGAMARLRLGDPRDMATDIGPVISAEAKDMLAKHAEKMKKEATLVAVAETPKLPGHFFPPHLFEIQKMSQLPGEVFGPVLHVIRYDAESLESVIQEINATGYGLTFGIHSRIIDRAKQIASRIRAGNCYINRGMTGAVVGVQPFGGEGLSGTGPKAGGPHYLLRFATEQAITLNTAAIGGNLDLLAKKQ